ncbi:MAG: glycoside hydrolase domain-containing protein, partial [Planctomycetota bacterium]
TDQRVANVARVDINREFGDLVFQADEPGEYYVYYLPWVRTGKSQFRKDFFTGLAYNPPQVTADPQWLTSLAGLDKLPTAEVVAIEAINDFHRFDPMEVIATADETAALLAAHANRPYLIFPEDRAHPIRMTDELPKRWIDAGPSETFAGQARRGECVAFQLGLYASAGDLEDVQIAFATDDGPLGDVTCINLGGTDWLGRSFTKRVDVAKGKVQALWCYSQVSADAAPGSYTATATVSAANAPETAVRINLTVTDELVEDSGDSDPSLLSRLAWLNSTTGLDDEVFEPYTPVELDGRTVGVLGRELTFNDTALPAAIRSFFAPTNDRVDAPPTEVLAEAMRFVVDAGAGAVQWQGGEVEIVDQASGAITWQATSRADGFTLAVWAKMECDGYVNYRLTLTADADADLADIALEIPIRHEAATYMMGLGHRGGRRPRSAKWQWHPDSLANQFWLGEVNAGLVCKLKHLTDDWAISHMRESGMYRDWSNEGRGRAMMTESEGGDVLLRAFTGPRAISAGEELHFNFGLLITPVKVLDKGHWHWRYYHAGSDNPRPPADYVDMGARIVNIHHATDINPHINYPFFTTDAIRQFADGLHEAGLKFKIYYTSRELTNYVPELWAMRSLGDEIFTDGPGIADPIALAELPDFRNHTGCAWLCEHLVSGYQAAWHSPLAPGVRDAAIETVGLSRLHNHYIEGLQWLATNCHIDGLYLDGIGYDREVFKRVRKVLQRSRPGSLIDFHSGDEYDEKFGNISATVKYSEHLPYVDSIWFGEGFDYETTDPDYWLVEVSGIPFGLFGEMLQDGGNAWRGMVYGMTRRLGWGGTPQAIWTVWDDVAIDAADMIGYWTPDCPVTVDHPDVRATVYRGEGRTLVAVASWADEKVDARLDIDWTALDIDAEKATITAPAVEDFQPAATFVVDEAVPIDPARGWMLIIE